MTGSQDYEPDPRNETVLVYVNGDARPAGRGSRVRLRRRASASATASGRASASTRAGFRSPTPPRPPLLGGERDPARHRDDAGGAPRCARRDDRRQRHGRRRPRAADGHARDEAHADAGSAARARAGHRRDRRGVEGAAAGGRDERPSLFTSSVRCTRPDMFDMRLNSHSRLHLITALHAGDRRGRGRGADARRGRPRLELQLHELLLRRRRDGVHVDRELVLQRDHPRPRASISAARTTSPLDVGDFSLSRRLRADEAFVTGTFGGVTPVREIDGRALPSLPGSMTVALRDLYAARLDAASS